MRNRLMIIVAVFLLVAAVLPLYSADMYGMDAGREGDLRIGLGMYALPIPNVEVLKIAPFGITAAYGLTDRLDAQVTFAPLNYFTAMILPQMIEGNEFIFVYVAEAGARYHLSSSPSSFYVEADFTNLGIFGNGTGITLAESLSGGIIFGGGGFGFSGPVGGAVLSVGLHGYAFIGDYTEDTDLPILPILKTSLLW